MKQISSGMLKGQKMKKGKGIESNSSANIKEILNNARIVGKCSFQKNVFIRRIKCSLNNKRF